MPANEVIPFYEVADRITCQATAALTGKRFVAISADRVSGPGLAATADGANYRVGVPAAGAFCFGVAMWDCPSGGKVPVIREGIVPVEVGAGGVTFGTEVQVDATGKVITLAAGRSVGYVCHGAAAAGFAEISLNVK